MDRFELSRRNFVKGGVAAVLASRFAGSTALASVDPNSHSNRIFHASHYGPFEAIVKDGKFVGVQPMFELDARPTEMLMYGMLDRTYDKSRILYPMVRKSYLENWDKEDRKVDLRGKEPFVRVDWDTALRLTAKAIVDTVAKYGNEALFSSSYGGWSHAGIMKPNVLQGRFFNLFGGSSMTIADYSAGASQVSLPFIIGDMEVYSPQTAWQVIRDNTEVFVLVGCDPIKNNRIDYMVGDHQMSAKWEEIRDAGVKFISINPQYTGTDEALGSEWIRIVPNTDVALFLAMSHEVIKAGKIDKAFLEKYTVGSDKVIDHIMGKDGTEPKTPEWASRYTGIPAAKITELALLLADKKTEIAGAWSLQRAHHGEMTHWAIVNFAALTGKIGLPGQGVGFSWHYGNGGLPQSGKAGPSGMSQGRNLVKGFCPASGISDMLLNPGGDFTRNGKTYKYPAAKLLYNSGNNFMSHQQNTNELIGALKVLEHVVCQDAWWTASTRWADIVLPSTCTVERDDISSGGSYSGNVIYAMKKVIDPVGESLDDYEIFRRLSALMGLEIQFTEGQDAMYHIEFAYGKSAAKDIMPFADFWKKGYVVLDTPKEANQWVRHGAFRADPEKNPLHTKSGKIEMFCQTIADMKIEDCPGMPMFMEAAEYLGNAKEGQVHVVSPHPWFRIHSQMANSERLRDLYYVQGREPIRISAEDAARNGIADGDLVELSNDRGALIAGAVVSDKIMPGVVSIYEGAWPNPDSKGRCNNGLINFITSSRRSSGLTQATTANTCVASLKKCTDAEGPSTAYEPPKIEEGVAFTPIEEAVIGLDRLTAIIEKQQAAMDPAEHLFYQRCTVCHGPRDPAAYTKLQWKGITEVMFQRAGLDDKERTMVLDFLEKNAADAN